jgi:glycosyltransferase involved in cell wall biosynthesis
LLLVINQLNPVGGAERQLTHLAIGLAERGSEVTVCCMDSSSLPAATLAGTGIRLVQLGAKTRRGRAAAVPRLARLARRADVVHCTMWDPSLWGRLAAILARRPVIVADHATDRSVQVASGGAPRASWIAAHNRLLDRFTFATVACASSQRAVLIEEGVDPDKIVHIPNGIPLAEMRRESAARSSRQELGLPAKGKLVMQVGLFRPEKNQAGALAAFADVHRGTPDAHLVFVGDGPQRGAVERRAAELDAGGWAHFLGNRSDVPALLGYADLLFLPSVSDAMPMTMLEAMALEVPTVATDVGDIRKVLAGEAGVCVPAGDTDALATACGDLLGDPVRREAMASAAGRLALQFDISGMIERYAALFEAACTGAPPLPGANGSP